MDYNDAHPSTLHADTHIERAAIIRLIKAHAKDCERRGARSLGHGYLALVSEIEDAMQHDTAHVEALENPPVKVPTPVPSVFDRSWLSDGVRITTRDRGESSRRAHLCQPRPGCRGLTRHHVDVRCTRHRLVAPTG